MSFRIERDTLTASLTTMDPRVRAAIELVYELFESRAENYMKMHAPWTDRTTNARNGLRAQAEQRGNSYSLTLFHTVPYGFWLEVAHDGKYAIIGPAQLEMGRQIEPVLAAAIRRAMESAA